MFVNAEIKVRVTNEDIDNIMSTAFYGGITYWCHDAEIVGDFLGDYVSEQISHDGELKLYVEDDEEYILNKEKFLAGLARYLSECGGFEFNERTRLAEIDTGCIDAEAADMIIQYAIFNEIVYA